MNSDAPWRKSKKRRCLPQIELLEFTFNDLARVVRDELGCDVNHKPTWQTLRDRDKLLELMAFKVDPDQNLSFVGPFNMAFLGMPDRKREEWAKSVLSSLRTNPTWLNDADRKILQKYGSKMNPLDVFNHFVTLGNMPAAVASLRMDRAHFQSDAGLSRIRELLANDREESRSSRSASFVEGRITEARMTRQERNPKARAACISRHGYSCKVCDMSFTRIYGRRGNGFIHVHHLEPVSAAKGPRSVDPMEDLIPVCPNCHNMLHRGNLLTIDALREIVRRIGGPPNKRLHLPKRRAPLE